MTTTKVDPFRAFLMVVLILFWGSSFVVVKTALNAGLTPVSIATFRFLMAGGLFAVLLLMLKLRKHSYRLSVSWNDVPAIVVLALTGVTFFFVAQYTGIKLAGPSTAAILVCFLSPILIAFVSAFILEEHLSRRQLFGIGVGAVGTLTVILGGTLGVVSQTFFLGSLILLLTPVFWTMYSLAGRKTLERYDPLLLTSYTNILGGLMLIPFSLQENSLSLILTMGLNNWLAILFLSVTCSVFGYSVWFYVLRRVGPTVTGTFLFAEPLVTVLFAVTFAGEILTPAIYVGAVLIFLGLGFVMKG